MPTIEPTVSEEKLRQLLDEGHESDLLDFKSTCNLDAVRDRVELAKDVGAMQVDGGYIVIGADVNGRPTGLVAAKFAILLDESVVRNKLTRYLSEPLDIRVATHSVDGHIVALVYVGPNPDGMAVFRADGNYPGGQAFRAGDVFVRHGTSSERWQQHDIARILARMVERQKESWRVEVTESIRSFLRTGQRAQDLAAGPADALDWRLDSETFTRTVVEQLRRGDDIPLRLSLDKMVIDARTLFSTGSHELDTLLDRLTCLAAVFLRIRRDEWTDEILQRFLSVYEIPVPPASGGQNGQREALWLAVAARFEAIGGLAVRDRNWRAVRRIAVLRTPGQDTYYPYLLRHTVVQAGRAGLLQPVDRKGVSLVSLAKTVADRLACVRPDLPSTNEGILDSITQFDFLAALAAISDYGRIDTRTFYPSFAYFFTQRAEPIVEQVLTNRELRECIFPGADSELAAALVTLNRLAMSEGFRFSGWDGFTNRTVVEFVGRHAEPE